MTVWERIKNLVLHEQIKAIPVKQTRATRKYLGKSACTRIDTSRRQPETSKNTRYALNSITEEYKDRWIIID